MSLTFTRSQRELLCRATAWEEKHPGHRESWTWVDVDAELGDTAKLLIQGFVDIVGEDSAGHNLYLLTLAGREQGK